MHFATPSFTFIAFLSSSTGLGLVSLTWPRTVSRFSGAFRWTTMTRDCECECERETSEETPAELSRSIGPCLDVDAISPSGERSWLELFSADKGFVGKRNCKHAYGLN